jgi:hypothetical protein
VGQGATKITASHLLPVTRPHAWATPLCFKNDESLPDQCRFAEASRERDTNDERTASPRLQSFYRLLLASEAAFENSRWAESDGKIGIFRRANSGAIVIGRRPPYD